MSGRLILHIGLPKTATTTLQTCYFPQLPVDSHRYLGTLQPRTARQDPLFLQLRESAMGKQQAGPVRSALATALDEGKNLVISEEMFTVSNGGVSWRTKLEHLASIVEGLDYKVLTTVRSPGPASFSYYVELEPRYRSARLRYLEAVASDEAMEIFDYEKLIPVLDGFFPPDRIYFKRFEEVTSARMTDVDRLLRVIRTDTLTERFTVTNKKHREGSVVWTGRAKTLADVLRRSAFARTLRGRTAMQPVVGSLKQALGVLERVKLGERSVPLPTDAEQEQVYRMLEPGWQRMLKRMESQCAT